MLYNLSCLANFRCSHAGNALPSSYARSKTAHIGHALPFRNNPFPLSKTCTMRLSSALRPEHFPPYLPKCAKEHKKKKLLCSFFFYFTLLLPA